MGNICSGSNDIIYFDTNDIIDMIANDRWVVTDGLYVYDITYLKDISHPCDRELFNSFLNPSILRHHMKYHSKRANDIFRKLIIGKYKTCSP